MAMSGGVCGPGGGGSTASRAAAAELPELATCAQLEAVNSEFTLELLFPVSSEKSPTKPHMWTSFSKLGKAGPYRHCFFPAGTFEPFVPETLAFSQ